MTMNTETTDPTDHSKASNDAGSSMLVRSNDQPGSSNPQNQEPVRPASRWLDWRLGAVLVVAAISIPVWRLVNHKTKTTVSQSPAAPAQSVPVARVTRQDLYNQVLIPAEFRPYLEVQLHAKVSGYLTEINVDFGDRVKANQLLAKLEVPELKAQYDGAVAAQKRAEAEYDDAHKIYTRLQAVVKDYPNLVAQQDLDNAEAKDSSTLAAIAAAKAEVEKYRTLLGYTSITAPFDGVITHRYADPGALIQAGTASDTQSMPLVRISDNYRLRLDIPVSLLYVKDVRSGDPVDVHVESLGDKTFTGTITRFTDRVDEETRTMITEVEVPNPNLELVPGMYARVVLKVQRRPLALAVPIDAVPPGQTNSVYVVNERNQIEERPVALGLETPTKCEVISGLKEGELVLTGGRSRVELGEKVEPVLNPVAEN
jgi:RND family efflux transporter MFP subunit